MYNSEGHIYCTMSATMCNYHALCVKGPWTKDIDLAHQGQFLMLDSQMCLLLISCPTLYM